MTFGDNYLKYLEVLQNIGMTSITPIKYNGTEIVPLQFLKNILPDPGSLGKRTNGKTCIGTIITGEKNNLEKLKIERQKIIPKNILREVGFIKLKRGFITRLSLSVLKFSYKR